MQKIILRICNRLEKLSIPSVNWLKTIYINLRLLPFNQATKLPIYVYGNPAFNSLSGKLIINCPIKKGLFKINYQHTYAPSLQTQNTQLCINGTIIIEGDVVIGCATKILVVENATLQLGHHTQIMDYCNIDCWSFIKLGIGVIISHRCQIMDSSHHYIVDLSTRKISDNKKSIKIEGYCWICNSSTILAGAVIPKHTIVSNNSLVNKDISDWGSYILVGGTPIKLLKRNVTRIYNVNNEKILFHLFKNSQLDIYEIDRQIDIQKYIEYEDYVE